jgi:hypothetical protein
MSKPVSHPQLGNLSITRAKLLFVEVMTADPTLTLRELRTGIVLINCVDATKGYGETSLKFIADAIGSNDSGVAKAVNILQRKGYFCIVRGTYVRGGRGHPNRYHPDWRMVQSSHPIADAAAQRNTVGRDSVSDSERPDKHCQDAPINTVGADRKSLLTVSTMNKSCDLHHTSPSGESVIYAQDAFRKVVRSKSKRKAQADAEFLRETERWLKIDQPYRAADLRSMPRLSKLCMEIYETRDVDDPLAQWALRIASELDWTLEQHRSATP